MKQRLTTELVQIPKLIRTLTTERIKRRELNKSTKLRVVSANAYPTICM